MKQWVILFFLLIIVFPILCMWMFPERSYYIRVVPDAVSFICLMDLIPVE